MSVRILTFRGSGVTAGGGSVTVRSRVSTRLASERVGRRVTKGTLAILGSVFSKGETSASKSTASLLPGAEMKIFVTRAR